MANLLSLLAWHGVAIIFAAFWTTPMWTWTGAQRVTRGFITLQVEA